MLVTATGSVGDRMAASANATGSGMAGISAWTNHPMPTTVNTTSPMASAMMARQSRANAPLGMRHPSRNSSGGMNSSRKRCESNATSKPA